MTPTFAAACEGVFLHPRIAAMWPDYLVTQHSIIRTTVPLMEAFHPKPQLIRDLIERTGHPEAAFRTLSLHGDLDPGHLEELDRTIDALPLTREHEIVLGLSALSTGSLLSRSLEEVAARA